MGVELAGDVGEMNADSMVVLDPADTIAAVASPPGPGFRGIVRLSGPESRSMALAGFTSAGDQSVLAMRKARGEVSGHFRLPALRPELPAAVLLWSGPHTYTGQPLAEIHTVGSPPLLGLLLAHVLALGARLAEPGEFTLGRSSRGGST